MGSSESRRLKAALACALFTLRRDRSCLSIHAAGRPPGLAHSATADSLVKKQYESLSSKRHHRAGSLRAQITAHPLRGSTRPQAFSLASEPVHEPLGRGACTWAQAGDSGDGLLCVQGHVVTRLDWKRCGVAGVMPDVGTGPCGVTSTRWTVMGESAPRHAQRHSDPFAALQPF